MKTTININGKEVEITLTPEQVKAIKGIDPMTEVFEYHKTTEEEFEKTYSGVSYFAKHQEIERLIVAFYNKGVLPNFNDTSNKYYPWFKLGKNFGYDRIGHWGSGGNVSARLCFLRREDLEDAVVKFLPQYKKSRNS